ncbi:MAG: hypothetical protein JKY15_02055 [Deltaproteobacteria bacterium]|nr:hypothetical protein [Deltaproteobacteria bacterium]
MLNESLKGKIDCIYGESALKQFQDIYNSDPDRLMDKAFDTFTNFVHGNPAKITPGKEIASTIDINKLQASRPEKK